MLVTLDGYHIVEGDEESSGSGLGREGGRMGDLVPRREAELSRPTTGALAPSGKSVDRATERLVVVGDRDVIREMGGPEVARRLGL